MWVLLLFVVICSGGSILVSLIFLSLCLFSAENWMFEVIYSNNYGFSSVPSTQFSFCCVLFNSVLGLNLGNFSCVRCDYSFLSSIVCCCFHFELFFNYCVYLIIVFIFESSFTRIASERE